MKHIERLAMLRRAEADGCTVKQVADLIGTSVSNIYSAERAHGLNFRRTAAGSEDIAALAADGLTIPEIALRLGFSARSVGQKARREGIKITHGHSKAAAVRKGTCPKAKMMAAMYRDGYTLQQIGDQYDITRERVRQLIKKHFDMVGIDGGSHAKAVRKKAQRTADRDARCWDRHGCSVDEWRELRQINDNMLTAGVSRYRTPLYAFQCQRSNAHSRGIDWDLSLWQWWKIWERSGLWDQRGRGQGFVMCRKGDVGPYAIGNVFIDLAIHNSSITNFKKSGLPIGVGKRGRLFVAKRMIGGVVHNLGSFKTAELAHAAYLSAAPVSEVAA